jgi:hypothetical protein
MSRKHLRRAENDLRFIQNVRPAMELSTPPRWTAWLMTAGLVIALTALLLFVMRG